MYQYHSVESLRNSQHMRKQGEIPEERLTGYRVSSYTIHKEKSRAHCGAFFLRLASETSETHSEAVHEIDEPHDEHERPPHLYEPKSEIHRSTNQRDKRVVDCSSGESS